MNAVLAAWVTQEAATNSVVPVGAWSTAFYPVTCLLSIELKSRPSHLLLRQRGRRVHAVPLDAAHPGRPGGSGRAPSLEQSYRDAIYGRVSRRKMQSEHRYEEIRVSA